MNRLNSLIFYFNIQLIYDKNQFDNKWKQKLIEWYLLEIRSNGLDCHDEKKRKILLSWSYYVGEYTTKYM